MKHSECTGHDTVACADYHHDRQTEPTLTRRQILGGFTALGASAGLPGFAAAQSVPARRIDVHHHPAPPAYAEALTARNSFFPPLRGWTVERSLADMDKGGVATSILSCAPPPAPLGDRDATRKVVRESNEFMARLAADHRGRFGVFLILPLPDVDGTLAEIAYGLDTLKADGVALYTSYGDKYLGDPSFAPLYEELNRRRAVVYTHPSFPACCGGTLVPNVPAPTIELSTDTSRTVASLVFSGTTAKYPNIRFILSHAGGTMPFLIERFDFEAKRKAEFLPNGLRHELRRFYYDTAQAFQSAPMAALRKVVPMSQIVFGSDFPYRAAEEHVTGLRASRMFTDKEMEAVDRGNALRLLPRFRTA
jgi:6-methylsalicylate decarboxylase